MEELNYSAGNRIISAQKYSSRNKMNIRYDLLLESSGGRAFYSLNITNTDSGESAYIPDITGLADLAETIFELLHRGFVTPCCAFEVVEDLLESVPTDKPPTSHLQGE